MCVLLQSVDKLLAQAGEGFVKVLEAQKFLCKYDASDRVERLLGKVDSHSYLFEDLNQRLAVAGT